MFFMWFMLFTLCNSLYVLLFLNTYWCSPIKIFVIRSSKQGSLSDLSLTTNISLWICVLVLAFSTRKKIGEQWNYDNIVRINQKDWREFSITSPTPALSLFFSPQIPFFISCLLYTYCHNTVHILSQNLNLFLPISYPSQLFFLSALWACLLKRAGFLCQLCSSYISSIALGNANTYSQNLCVLEIFLKHSKNTCFGMGFIWIWI